MVLAASFEGRNEIKARRLVRGFSFNIMFPKMRSDKV